MPSAGSCVLPKKDPIAEVKLVPLIVNPVIVVETPAVSCSCTATFNPVEACETEFGTTDAITTAALGDEPRVTVTEPLELLKAVLPLNVAVMVLLPLFRLAAFTVRAAVPLLPDAVRFTEPSVVLPTAKVTLPEGAVVPDAGLTDAVITVVPPVETVVELAETVVVVVMVCACTVTVAEPVEVAKLVEDGW